MIGHQKRLNLTKCLDISSNQAILASGPGLGLQINLQICGFYEGLAAYVALIIISYGVVVQYHSMVVLCFDISVSDARCFDWHALMC